VVVIMVMVVVVVVVVAVPVQVQVGGKGCILRHGRRICRRRRWVEEGGKMGVIGN